LHAHTRPSLLLRVRNSEDQEAWREFDELYRDLILGYCRRRGLQRADAEDIRQLVMLSLAQAIRGFAYDRERGRFRSYLFRIVHNSINRNFLRPKRADLHLDTEVQAVLEAPGSRDMDAAWEDEWVQHHYRRAMQRVQDTFEKPSLDQFQRLLDGASVPEVAREFRTSEQAVHKVKQRVRRRLKESIEQQVSQEEGGGSEEA